MKRATIIDVAKAAGVSIKTVSRVLNSEPNVRLEKQHKIRQVIRELNYSLMPSAHRPEGRRVPAPKKRYLLPAPRAWYWCLPAH